MKSYDKIEYWNKGPFGEDCIGFDKLDGSNLRFEWSNKRGFYKFGSRSILIDKNAPILGESIDIFMNKYSNDLDRIFKTKYKKVPNFVVFCEFLGENSFSGQHVESDKKDVVLFDVNQYKRGIIDPFEFVDNFGNLHIPEIIYEGKYNEELISDIRNSKNLKEGIVCKGVQKTKKGGTQIWMTKIKTDIWLNKVKELYGEKALLEEFNNDKSLLEIFI